MNSAVDSSNTPTETELSEFRAEVGAWMRDNNPPDPGFLLPQTFMEVGSDQQLEFLREWQHKLWSAGYLGMAWPKAYGGGGLPAIYQMIADSEMRKAGAAATAWRTPCRESAPPNPRHGPVG